MLRDRVIYLAAPFFNAPEAMLVSQIEDFTDRLGSRVELFSPRRDGGNKSRQGNTKSNAKEIFEANEDAMARCDEMLCWLDRPQPADHGIYLMRTEEHECVETIAGPFEQTDLGVAWEMGWMWAQRRQSAVTHTPIIGFSLRPWASLKVNIMLAQCLDGILCSAGELNDYLADPEGGFGYLRRHPAFGDRVGQLNAF